MNEMFEVFGPGRMALSGALAAALVPQAADAALVTVGGDGGVGTVTLENPGDSTDLGGVLAAPIFYRSAPNPGGGSDFFLRFDGLTGGLFEAVRSSVSTPGIQAALAWTFWRSGYSAVGATFDSADNWLPGVFHVNGVNGGNPIWGWLQVRLGSGPGDFTPTILSFTYDDEATDDTPFLKPVGGFSVPGAEPVPEPSSLGLTALGLGAAFVSRMRRRKWRERDG